MALAVAGVMNDDQAHPGRPLRELLRKLRDTNVLPQNVKQLTMAAAGLLKNIEAFEQNARSMNGFMNPDVPAKCTGVPNTKASVSATFSRNLFTVSLSFQQRLS